MFAKYKFDTRQLFEIMDMCDLPAFTYHAAFVLDSHNVKEKFNQLAINKPEEFYEFAQHDNWSEVESLLTKEALVKVSKLREKMSKLGENQKTKQDAYFTHQRVQIQQSTPLSPGLLKIIEGYLNDQENLRKAEELGGSFLPSNKEQKQTGIYSKISPLLGDTFWKGWITQESSSDQSNPSTDSKKEHLESKKKK